MNNTVWSLLGRRKTIHRRARKPLPN